jgi:hypothetical protein
LVSLTLTGRSDRQICGCRRCISLAAPLLAGSSQRNQRTERCKFTGNGRDVTLLGRADEVIE